MPLTVEPPELHRSRTSPARVVVVGSLNVDSECRVARSPGAGETVLSHASDTRPGGKGANQTDAAARAGARVVVVGACGDDSGGTALVFVADDGEHQIVVDQGANVSRDAGATTVSLSRLCLDVDDVVIVSFEIPEPAVVATVLAGTASGSTVLVTRGE